MILANAFTYLTGGDKHFIEFAKKGLANGWDVKVVTTKSGSSCCLKEGLNAEFCVVQNWIIDKLGLVFSYFIRTLLAVIFVLKEKKSLIVYSSSDSLPDILPGLFSKFFRKSSVWISCVFHIVPHPFEREGGWFRNFLSHYTQQLGLLLMRTYSDLILVDNNILKNELINKGFNKDKIVGISMGISKEFIDSIPQEEKIYDACFLGRLHPTKGIFDLVKIWNEVSRHNLRYRLGIIGTGDKRIEKRLMQSIKENNLLDNINLFGNLKTSEVYRVLKMSRIFMFPSYEEGWGICIAEAIACGLPVVVYNLPVFKEIFPEGIIYVEKGNWDAFADVVINLLDDNSRIDELRQIGLDLVQHYSWDSVTDREWQEIKRSIEKNIVSTGVF